MTDLRKAFVLPRRLIQLAMLMLAVSLSGGWLLVGSARACNIPVFRYALERWSPDASEVIVYHEGPLTAEQLSAVEKLRSRSFQQQGPANAKVLLVDVAGTTADARRDLWADLKKQDDVSLPHVLVRSKLGQGRFVNHFHSNLQTLDLDALFDSPLRREIRQRLVAGHSVVWLMVRGKDPLANERAKKLVEAQFDVLAKQIQLPEGIGLPGSELYAEVPLLVKFSLVEVAADDPNEKFMVDLLGGLREQAFADGEPLLVPIFGRGRALEVIPASDLTTRLMRELTAFLSGACSCQVKEQNPGFDLLIEARWDDELFGGAENRPPDRTAEEGRNRGKPELVPIPPG